MGLLVRGNSKLGKDIWSFSLPAIDTCPGSTSLCRKICYAARYQKRFKNTLVKYENNLQVFNKEDMIKEIFDISPKVVRIHVAGDFYSVDYINDWIDIIKACSHVTFYAYTRSYGVDPELNRELKRLSALDNMTLLLSTDKEKNHPDISKSFREAAIDAPSWRGPQFLSSQKIITCPEQTGKAASCSKCKLCFSTKLKNRKDIVINFLEH